MQIWHKSLISKFSGECARAVVGHAPHVCSGRLFISMPRGGPEGDNAPEFTCALAYNRYLLIH